MTRTAVPSTTTSLPLSQPLAPVLPVVTATCGLASRLRCFCSFGPVQKAKAPSCQTPVRADCDDPVELRVDEEALDVIPRWWGGRCVAVSRIDPSGRHVPFDWFRDGNSSA